MAGFGSHKTVGRLAFDTCVFIRKEKKQAEVIELERLRDQGLVEIVKSDLVDQELSDKYNERIGEEFDISCSYVELHSVNLLGDSRLNHSVTGTLDEEELIKSISKVLKPGAVCLGLNDQRDARHIAAAKKYGCLAFVTTDDNILKHAKEMKTFFDIEVVSPAMALVMVKKLIMRRRKLEDLKIKEF